MGSSLDQQVARHVQDVYGTLDALFAAAEAVRDLADHPGWAHIDRIVQAEVATIDRRLDAGTEPLTQAQYAMAHGRRSGLRAAANAAEAILLKAQAAHDEQRRKHEGAAEPVPGGR